MFMTMFFSYGRPGEIRGLRRRQFLFPTRSTGPLSHYGLVFAPQETDPLSPQALSKTGTMDDTVLLDAPGWFGVLLAQVATSRAAEDPLFSISAADSVVLFNRAVSVLGLPKQCMYQFRHGGASEDVLGRVRTIDEVKSRGRWKSDGSIRRYAKPSMLGRLLGLLEPAKLGYCRDAWRNLEKVAWGQMAATLPQS